MELIIGLTGMVLLLGSYTLLITKRIDPESRTYLLLNVIASSTLLIYAYMLWSIPFLIINTFWIAITVIKLITLGSNKEEKLSGN